MNHYHDVRTLLWFAFATWMLSACSGAARPDEEQTAGDISNPIDAVPEFVAHSVVQVRSGATLCSGVLIAQNRVATGAHCVRAHDTPLVGFGTAFGVQATVLRRHPTADLAVLLLPWNAPGPYAPVKIHTLDPSEPMPGHRILIAGFGVTANGASDWLTLRAGKTVFRSPSPNYAYEGGTYADGFRFSPDTCSKEDPACSNFCAGDSGGPVFHWRKASGWGVIGIQSATTCRGRWGSGLGAFGLAANLPAARTWALQ
jgi:Trypsin